MSLIFIYRPYNLFINQIALLCDRNVAKQFVAIKWNQPPLSRVHIERHRWRFWIGPKSLRILQRNAVRFVFSRCEFTFEHWPLISATQVNKLLTRTIIPPYPTITHLPRRFAYYYTHMYSCRGQHGDSTPLGSIHTCDLSGVNYSLNNGLYCTHWAHSHLIFVWTEKLCTYYRPQTKFVKVMFLQVSLILSTAGWYPSMPCSAGVSRPTPREEVEGSGGGVSRPTPEGMCIPACTEADPYPLWTATTAGGTHPTGMHSCFSGMLGL